MTPNEKRDMPWVVAIGLAFAIVFGMYYLGLFQLAAALICWGKTGCEF